MFKSFSISLGLIFFESSPQDTEATMDRVRFSRYRESGSFLRYDAGPDNNSRERGSSPRDKIWSTLIECSLVAIMFLIVVIKVIG